jgi:hypothetical protein
LTRHELKEQLQHDQFTDTVSNALGYANTHRQQVVRWAALGIAVLAIGSLLIWYMSYRKSVRQQDLNAALAVVDAQVGPHNEYVRTFNTAEEKRDAALKALSNVVAKDGGTREGYIAQYYRGTLRAQKNDNAGAESDLRAVADSHSETAALAKIALAHLFVASNKTAQAQDLLRSIVNKPTDLVSQAQAEVLLAQLDESFNPKESKRILQTLKKPGESAAVSRAADQLSAQLAK